jgi:hypothetical protein
MLIKRALVQIEKVIDPGPKVPKLPVSEGDAEPLPVLPDTGDLEPNDEDPNVFEAG